MIKIQYILLLSLPISSCLTSYVNGGERPFSTSRAVKSSAAAASIEDLNIVYERRKEQIIRENSDPVAVDLWRNSLTVEGTWPDVNYTAGCPARRANWPAREHFIRILTMASHWSQNLDDIDLLDKISLAMDYWFDRDFQEPDCINAGGDPSRNCPCDTPGFWNTNWYCQMIQMPTFIGKTCLLLLSELSTTQLNNCTTVSQRSHERIDGDPNGSAGPMTGANMLDVSYIGANLAILTSNVSLMEEAFGRYYEECQLTTDSSQEGIKVDGSYFQHGPQIYTGNYGSVFMQAMLKTFIQTENTSLEPPLSTQEAFLTLINGSEWFIYRKSNQPSSTILQWQYSVIGRMVSHMYEDWQGIGIRTQEIMDGTQSWENHEQFAEIVNRLTASVTGVNPGPLAGTRYFHISDYLVHRGPNYIVTLKMYSRRSINSECNNSQNPYGFHLSDGTIYTYLDGSEYINVFGAWDWYLIPGTTVDYASTRLQCGQVQFRGKEDFVGGVALGHAGIAVMNFTNPMTESLHWKKSYFFFPGAYVVQFVGDVISLNSSSPVLTTLDQRQLAGDVYINGELMQEPQLTVQAQYIWHSRVGYYFQSPVTLNVDITARPSNWSAIGISNGTDPETLFSASFVHPTGGNSEMLTYMALLDVDEEKFSKKEISSSEQPVKILSHKSRRAKNFLGKNGNILEAAEVRGAVYEKDGEKFIGLCFWSSGSYETGLNDILAVSTDLPVLLLFERKPDQIGWTLAVADPTQAATEVNILVHASNGDHDLQLTLPIGPWAGSHVIAEFNN